MRERQSLRDLFQEFSGSQALFVEYNNGYRSWKYTYAQLGLAARRFASRLGEHNIRKGDKVIFWSENRPEWVAAFWGCVLTGAIVVPVDYRSSPQFLRRIQQTVDAKLILLGEEVWLPPWHPQPPIWQLSDLEWPASAPEMPSVSIEKNDIAEIVFTSGATGAPKGVLIAHRNILANIVSPEQIISKYRKWFRPLFPLRFLSLVPLSHMFGQIFTLFVLPLIPGVAVFMRGYSPYEILRQTRTRHVSVIVAVPKILEILRKQVMRGFPQVAGQPSSSSHWIRRWWKYRGVHSALGWKFWAFLVGAAPLSTELETFWTQLGFAVIQGYGLTETAPVVAFNNPFDIAPGTVGKPIFGMEVKIAPDGEILVRGESVTPGYYQAPAETAAALEGGWFHTGDIGSFDAAGNLTVRGRKKETIVTPEGLNVFPEDVEHVLNELPGVRESAAVGRDRVHAVLVLEKGGNPDEIVRLANRRLAEYQQVRSVSVWPGDRLPRTESTGKLKHPEIQAWVEQRGPSPAALPSGSEIIDLLGKYAPNRLITSNTTLGELGLSSLDRVELLIDLEQQFDTSIDESLLTGACTVSELNRISAAPGAVGLPAWNRSGAARMFRGLALSLCWLPLTRLVAHAQISGREHLASLRGPVIFAPNHQSHLDTPLVLSALPRRYRHHVAVAMWQEYFDAHFHPERHTPLETLRQRVLYGLVALFFNTFAIPQTEVGARQSLRHIGDLISANWSVLFFPEGQRAESDEITPFQPGIGLIASRLQIPIVPVRLRGVQKVLHRHAWRPRPGRVSIVFGAPLRLKGDNYAAIAKEVQEAVAAL
jgi:long-chain acyl-CoA synthetase